MSKNAEFRKAAAHLPLIGGATTKQYFWEIKRIFKAEGDEGVKKYIKLIGYKYNEMVAARNKGDVQKRDDNVRKIAKNILADEPNDRA